MGLLIAGARATGTTGQYYIFSERCRAFAFGDNSCYPLLNSVLAYDIPWKPS